MQKTLQGDQKLRPKIKLYHKIEVQNIFTSIRKIKKKNDFKELNFCVWVEKRDIPLNNRTCYNS